MSAAIVPCIYTGGVARIASLRRTLRRYASGGAAAQAECAWAGLSGPTVHEFERRTQDLRALPRRGHPRCRCVEDADRERAPWRTKERPGGPLPEWPPVPGWHAGALFRRRQQLARRHRRRAELSRGWVAGGATVGAVHVPGCTQWAHCLHSQASAGQPQASHRPQAVRRWLGESSTARPGASLRSPCRRHVSRNDEERVCET